MATDAVPDESTRSKNADALLDPLRAAPQATALLFDVDGTLAPIVDDPSASAVPGATLEALGGLAGRYALVGFVSGRRAADARRIVGVGTATYVGNHGLELLEPGEEEPRTSRALGGHEEDAARFVAALDGSRLKSAGLRVEDKGPIRALHWRGVEDEGVAEGLASEIASGAGAEGLQVHRGRKVLELRPPLRFDKGMAIEELLSDRPVRHALYAGDDRTDLDAFRRLRELVRGGGLETAVCVGIDSPESPAEVAREADLTVPDPAALAELLRRLATAPDPRTSERSP